MIISSILNSLLFSEIITLLIELNEKSIQWQKKKDNANNVMDYIQLSYNKQEHIREYLLKTSDTKQKQDEFDTFFDLISPSLKVRVQQFHFSKRIRQNKAVARVIVMKNQIKIIRKPGRRYSVF